MIAAIDSRNECIALETSGRVMELDHKDGKLCVHYSDRLVTLLREVRQLSAYGYLVPPKIQQTATTAMKFYKQAVTLKKVSVEILYVCYCIIRLLIFITPLTKK